MVVRTVASVQAGKVHCKKVTQSDGRKGRADVGTWCALSEGQEWRRRELRETVNRVSTPRNSPREAHYSPPADRSVYGSRRAPRSPPPC